MSSILTNSSAMVALQTLKGINSSLSTTQSQISTGKTVSSAKDNAAVWAISKTMETDVQAFKGVSDSLALGETTVSVARKASETVTSLLGDMREKIVNAQGDNVDRNKLQTDIVALREQIASVVGAAQFNGLNLVDGSTTSTNVLSSLDRASNGTVTASSITVTGQDLSIGSYAANDVFGAGSGNATVSGNADTFALSIDSTATDTVTIQDGATAWAAGDKVSMQIGDKSVSYTVSASDVSGTNSVSDLVAIGLKTAIDGLGISGLTVNYDSANPGELSFDNQTGNDLSVTGQFANAGAGGLGGLSAIDVSSVAGATAALGSIDALIATAVDATAAFGSVEGRISTQADFISSLSDSVKSGIGSLVDADMEEASARLQALQTQQQLGISSLSIANQQPQNILSLFR